MTQAAVTITDADIIAQVVVPDKGDLGPDSARAILDLKFTEEAESRMHDLLEKNNQGTLSEGERAEMESYSRVGNFLALMQAKARLSLANAT